MKLTLKVNHENSHKIKFLNFRFLKNSMLGYYLNFYSLILKFKCIILNYFYLNKIFKINQTNYNF